MRATIVRRAIAYLFLMVILSSTLHAALPLKISLGYLPHIQFAPFYLAQSRGYFAQENLAVTLDYTDTTDALPMLDQKKIDLALIDSDQLIFARLRGMRVLALFQYYEALPTSILAIDPAIKNVSDLRGKKIGVPELSGSSYIALLLFLRRFQLENKVEILRIGYQQIPLLQAKKIDAAIGYLNNEPIFLKENNAAVKEWQTREFIGNFPGGVIAVNEKVWREKRPTFDGFRRALNRAIDDLKGNPEEAFKEIAPILKITSAQEKHTLASLKATLPLFPSDPRPSPKAYQSATLALYNIGLLKGRVRAVSMVVPDTR